MTTTHTPDIRYSHRDFTSEGSCSFTPHVRSKFSPVFHFLRAARLSTRPFPPHTSNTSRANPRFTPSPHKAPTTPPLVIQQSRR